MPTTALGVPIDAFLNTDDMVSVMACPCGRIWTNRLDVGLADSGLRLAAADVERLNRSDWRMTNLH